MSQKAFSRKIHLLGIFFLSAIILVSSDQEKIDDGLKRFLGSLEGYEKTPNDIVLLLEESGYIGYEGFSQVKMLAKLIIQRFSVSAKHSRIAVVTFSTDTITHVNYIQNPNDSNMCALLKEIDDIGYVGAYRYTMKAMQTAEKILAESRPDSEKIIILLTNGPSNPGYSPVSVSNRLKSNGVVIFAVGVEVDNEAEINEVATSVDHTYTLQETDYLTELENHMVRDSQHSLDLAKSSFCDSLCQEHASCYCETTTERPKCICNAGYYVNEGKKGQCRKCPIGTYKAEPKQIGCTNCPSNSTTREEGSTSSEDCLCHLGYKKVDNTCLRIGQPELPRLPPKEDVKCAASLANRDYNTGDEVDASLPLLGKLIRLLPSNKRLPKIMELLNDVYDESNKGN